MRDETEVRDLFEGAYLLIKGFELKDLTVTNSSGRKVGTFVLSGEKVQIASEDYRSGRATANVKMLKMTVDHLKDLLFQKIKKVELHQHIKRTLREQGEERKCLGYQKSIK
ncbi:MAG: hypothetical protein HQL32_08355 [Planctomycetes bacterium]|nr:hypothetical protein [Planctomycetota bacterium]